MFVLRSTQNASGLNQPASSGFFYASIGTDAVDTAASHRKSPAVTPRMPACKSVDRSCGKTGSRFFVSLYKSDPHHVSRNFPPPALAPAYPRTFHHASPAPVKGPAP